MAIDWSRYPALPEPPSLPEGRDTPEREACWRDCCEHVKDISFTKAGWLLFGAIVLAEMAVFGWKRVLAGFLALIGFIPVLIVHFICTRIWMLIQEIRIARRHGMFYQWKLHRRNIDPEIAAVLAERPPFDAAAFRACWPTSEEADMAEWMFKVAEPYWRFHGKMLYPNDPLHLFFFGRISKKGKNKSIGELECFFSDLGVEPEGVLTIDAPLAELVEMCMNAHGGQKG